MLKIVVFDSGYGGEFFADKLAEELPVVEIIRVIDWRHADQILKSPKAARKLALDALRPYIGKVDLIIFANYLLTITSLSYFRHKFKSQSFVGMAFDRPRHLKKCEEIPVLTTKAVAKTLKYQGFIFKLHFKTKTITLDSWPTKIDDGELNFEEIRLALAPLFRNGRPHSIVLACSQFYDVKSELKKLFGPKLIIYDYFADTINSVNRSLKIRGGVRKSKD